MDRDDPEGSSSVLLPVFKYNTEKQQEKIWIRMALVRLEWEIIRVLVPGPFLTAECTAKSELYAGALQIDQYIKVSKWSRDAKLPGH